MTAAQLADLTGYAAREAYLRVLDGDKRDFAVLVNEVYREAGCPDLRPVSDRIVKMIEARK